MNKSDIKDLVVGGMISWILCAILAIICRILGII